MTGALRVGQVAALAGVSRDTLRYYERLGLLPKIARTPAGYRQYPPAIINRLMLVRNAQRFGFSLPEIAAFLHVREAGHAPCHDVRAAAQRMLHAIDQQIADLIARREQMHNTLRAWDKTLGRTPDGKQARLLETLDARQLPQRPPARATGLRRATRPLRRC
jgi:MerR family transcriptional regulator, copper efflux regulator